MNLFEFQLLKHSATGQSFSEDSSDLQAALHDLAGGFLVLIERVGVDKVVEDKMEVYGHHVIGEIVGVLADESVLDEKDKVDVTKLNAFVFDQFRNGYYAIGEKVGQAWHTGAPLMKK